jgi:hypothetical protein
MSKRGHYPGGHSVWYSDSARAQSYGEVRSTAKKVRGGRAVHHHQPARPYEGSAAVVHEWTARNGKPKPKPKQARRKR